MNTRLLKINKITALYYARFHLPMIRVRMINIESFASVVESSLHVCSETSTDSTRNARVERRGKNKWHWKIAWAAMQGCSTSIEGDPRNPAAAVQMGAAHRRHAT